MKNAILLAKNQEYVSRKCEKSYFSKKYRISAQNRIRPRRGYTNYYFTKHTTAIDDDDFLQAY